MRLLPLLMLLCVTAFAAEAFNPYRTVPEVKLSDGRTLTNFRAISYTDEGINGTWTGGGGVVAYDLFPGEWGEAIARFKPKPQPEPEDIPPPVLSKMPLPRKASARTAAEIRAGIGRPVPRPREPIIVPAPDLSPLKNPSFTYAKTAFSQTLEGQCFIVVKAGSSVKLALVPVMIYPKAYFDVVGKDVLSRVERYNAQATPMLLKLARESDDRFEGQYDIVKQNRELLWNLLPPSPVATKTDADGRFQVRHDVGEEFVVVAFAERSLGEREERYAWVVASSMIPKDGPFFLSNDNLLAR